MCVCVVANEAGGIVVLVCSNCSTVQYIFLFSSY